MKIGTLAQERSNISSRSVRTFSKEELLQRQFFLYMSGGMAIGALIWGLITLYFELYLAAAIPGAFILATLINFKICSKTGNLSFACNVQILFSLILPVAFQTLLGGYQATGCVMFWSLVSMMGAMTFQQRKIIYGWFVLFIACIVWSVLNESWVSKNIAPGINDISSALFAINFVMVSSILFGLSRYFIIMQSRMRRVMKSRSAAIKAVSREVESQNEEIGQSIRYAQNLQNNILPREGKLAKAFKDYFVLFQPKDIVSGDFYWYGEKDAKKIFAVIDCTGHGVPGAFMSMMAYNLMNELVLGGGIIQPAEILERLNHSVIRSLKQHATGNQDGMDLSIIVIDEANHTLRFAGARSNMYVVPPNGESTLLKGDRMSIGGVHRSFVETFTKIELPYEPGTTLYMATDGICDQFGGPNNKKFGAKRLVEWFDSQHNVSFRHQEYALEKTLSKWQGDGPQIDDILVAGIRI